MENVMKYRGKPDIFVCEYHHKLIGRFLDYYYNSEDYFYFIRFRAFH